MQVYEDWKCSRYGDRGQVRYMAAKANYAVVSTNGNHEIIDTYEEAGKAYGKYNRTARVSGWTTMLVKGYGYKWERVIAEK